MRCTFIAVILLALSVFPAHAAVDTYTMADFDRVRKIDAHLHLHGDSQRAYLAQARKDKFRALTINVDYGDFPPLAQQRAVASALAHDYPGEVAWVASFATQGFERSDWTAATLQDLDAAIADGAVGVKVWKNIGMELRGADGALVMVDDPRFAALFAGLAQRGTMVLGHQGEPHNCWLPLEHMTVNNDREYFRAHPAYHMYRHPELPGYEQQMAARDRLLATHPTLRYTGVHLASLEWDIDRLAHFLDAHPGVNVDLAARIGQLQYQSQRDRARVRAFLIRYQDRLMYGSDLAQSGSQRDADFAADLATVWRRDWRYFATATRQTVPELDAPVSGLALPRRVIDKLFRENAESAYPAAWRKRAGVSGRR
ncbi:MAG: amidohydrolase [Sphingomonadaceae bacterium]